MLVPRSNGRKLKQEKKKSRKERTTIRKALNYSGLGVHQI